MSSSSTSDSIPSSRQSPPHEAADAAGAGSRQAHLERMLINAICSSLDGTVLICDGHGCFVEGTIVPDRLCNSGAPQSLSDLPGITKELAKLLTDGYGFDRYLVNPTPKERCAPYWLTSQPIPNEQGTKSCGCPLPTG